MIDFMETIRHSFMHDNNPNNPANKPDLLRSLKNVRAHKTFINDENVSITRKYDKFKNVPSDIRITTVCCLVARELRLPKTVFVIEMFISEVAFVAKEIFKKNFELMGTLFKTYFIEDVMKIIYHSKPTWPNRKDPNNTNICPDFNFTPTQNTASVEVREIDDLVHFIEGKHCDKQHDKHHDKLPKKKKKKHPSTPKAEQSSDVPLVSAEQSSDRTKFEQSSDRFDPEAAREFLRQRWLQAVE